METIAAISGYYAQGGEVDRLNVGRGKLEFLRTQDVLRRLFADRDGWLEGNDRTVALLDALRLVEQEPSLFGITSHLLTVAVVK